jgi:predicted nucleic acid-binding protein
VFVRLISARRASRRERHTYDSYHREDCLSRTYGMIPLNGEVLDGARSLMERLGLQYPLRALDSLQLACAMRSGAEDFLCHDNRLAEMAEHIGFTNDAPSI